MQRQREQITDRCLALLVVVCLCFSAVPAAEGFIALDHRLHEHFQRRLNILISHVHQEVWTIGYGYTDNCLPAERKNGQAIEEAITMSLNAWLQPVRDMNTGKPVVADFRYVPDLVFPVPEAELKSYTLVIAFSCDIGLSTALGYVDEPLPPEIHMHIGTVVNDRFAGVLLHEIGHTFGLSDTYTNPDERIADEVLWVSTGDDVSGGGLVGTIGHQPASVMSDLNFPLPLPTRISQDDANGIVWLYKFYHEDLAFEDCIFLDYELEKWPIGCRPKSPLIFEIEYGNETLAIGVINDDENTDLNAKDENGMTALQHAVIKEYPKLVDELLSHQAIDVNITDGSGLTALHYAIKGSLIYAVKALLAHDGIDVEVKDKDSVTPLQLANQLGYTELADLISAHIEAKSARPKYKLVTVWGALKVK